MGWEPVFYKENSFDLNNQIISWLQKFMELYLLSLNHPTWFNTVLEDLHGNFHVPHGKYFFDESIIGLNEERLNYCISMIDFTIAKMKVINKKEFFDFIRDGIKGSWCDISPDFYNEEWLNDNENYKEEYIGSLLKLKEMMMEDMGTVPYGRSNNTN